MSKRTWYWAVALAVGCIEAEELTPPSDDDEFGSEYEPYDPDSKVDGASGLGGPMTFPKACAAGHGETITIAAVGDVLIHERLQRQALGTGKGFTSLWGEATDLLSRADLTYANLEGPSAPGVNRQGQSVRDPGRVYDGVVYTTYARFNYHPSLLTDLKQSGVDIVSTANNHALDRQALGVDRTIEQLRKAELPFTGTRTRGDARSPWYAVTKAKGFSVAWIACTFSTNGIADSSNQVLWCYRDTKTIESLIKDLAQSHDAVVVAPHWGNEYQARPSTDQIQLGHRFLEAGATAILGSHPHVLQPWEKHITRDGREGFIIYSLGNFVSGQHDLPRRSTLLLYMSLTRGKDHRVRVSGIGYVPLYMQNDIKPYELHVIERSDRHDDSRELTVRMFGEPNLSDPDAPLALPQCMK